MKEQIKDWLRSNSRDRQWLADRCGVTKRTVDNWLSTSIEIPTAAARLIATLMATDIQRISELPPKLMNAFVLEVDEPTFEAYNRAANAQGLLMKPWAISELDRAAREARELSALDRVAEDGENYTTT
jgi:hypothetical protein